jgi:hypothetical protein
MDKQHKHKRDSSKPANAYFGTFVFLQLRQPIANKNTKESKFSNRTPTAKTIIESNYVFFQGLFSLKIKCCRP